MKRLTIKEELFAVEYVRNGGNATQAYRDAYNPKKTAKPNTVWRMAHTVHHRSKVKARIFKLRTEAFSGHVLSIEQRKEILTEMALSGNIKAIAELNKMEGVYQAEEVEEETKEIIFRRL